MYTCFDTLPGNMDYDKYKNNIIFGSENSWSKSIYLNLRNYQNIKYICEKYFPVSVNQTNGASLSEIYDKYNEIYGSTTHMTFIFNVFVYYTLFNQINCRVIDDSCNIFARIDKGFMFILVTFGEMLIQFFIVQYGGGVFHCVEGGLSFTQFTLSLIFASSTFIFSAIIKYIPIDKYIDYYLAPDEDKDKFRPIPTIGFGKEVSVMISNLFNKNDYERINNNYMKIIKDDEHKIEEVIDH